MITTITGLLSILLFILINNHFLKLTAGILYIVISIIRGKRVKITPNVILFITIVIINVVVPQGEVLFRIWKAPITSISLNSGINNASLLIGLIYLSRNMDFMNMKIPGRAGLLVKESFYYFNQLSEGEKITPGNFMTQIDKRLLNLSHKVIGSEETSNNKKSLFILFPIITLILFALDTFVVNNF